MWKHYIGTLGIAFIRLYFVWQAIAIGLTCINFERMKISIMDGVKPGQPIPMYYLELWFPQRDDLSIHPVSLLVSRFPRLMLRFASTFQLILLGCSYLTAQLPAGFFFFWITYVEQGEYKVLTDHVRLMGTHRFVWQVRGMATWVRLSNQEREIESKLRRNCYLVKKRKYLTSMTCSGNFSWYKYCQGGRKHFAKVMGSAGPKSMLHSAT